MKSAAFANMILRSVFAGAPLELPPVLYVSLHTDDPGVDGNQSDHEAAYVGYQRVPIAREDAAWVFDGQRVGSVSKIPFPPGMGGGEKCAFACIGFFASGPGMILYRAVLKPAIPTGEGLAPELPSMTFAER